MDGKMNDCGASAEADIGHFINYVRVATAMAIIKSKPQNITILEHAQQVCGSYVSQQSDWKDRAMKLEDEVLFLKQKLLKSQMAAGSQDKDSSEDESQSLFPTPPESTEQASDFSQPLFTSDNHCLSHHVTFLKSITSLKSLSNHSVNSAIPLDNSAIDTCVKTVKSAMNIIENWFCDEKLRTKLPFKVIEYSIDVIVQLVDESYPVRALHLEVCGCVMAFAKSVLVNLVHDSSLAAEDKQTHLQKILLSLSRCFILRAEIATMLMKCIHEYSENLRELKQTQTQIEPNVFENMCIVFEMLEHLIENELKEDCGHLSLTEEVCSDMSTELENSLLHISETFPLFAHYVWHIGGLIGDLNVKLRNKNR